MKQAQIFLYNQLRFEYLDLSLGHFLYVHNTGKIFFQGRELSLNTASKVIDYAGSKHLIDDLKEK